MRVFAGFDGEKISFGKTHAAINHAIGDGGLGTAGVILAFFKAPDVFAGLGVSDVLRDGLGHDVLLGVAVQLLVLEPQQEASSRPLDLHLHVQLGDRDEHRWVEKAEQRRRRYYTLTEQGRQVLRSKEKSWKDFVAVISQVTGIEHA